MIHYNTDPTVNKLIYSLASLKGTIASIDATLTDGKFINKNTDFKICFYDNKALTYICQSLKEAIGYVILNTDDVSLKNIDVDYYANALRLHYIDFFTR